MSPLEEYGGPSVTFKDETNFQIDQLRQGEPHSIQRSTQH